mgnify:FL=1
MTRPVAMKCTLIAFAVFWLGIADARIEAPDHVIYGTATVFGDPAASGQVIQVRRRASGELLAQYRLGASERLGDQYAVRIPMDTVEPRVDGFARPGDLINIFISGELAGKAAVGKAGHAVRLDIDPQNVGDGPSLEVVDAEVFEGNSGTVQATFEATMNTTSDNDVIVSWNTVDGSAIGGGSCTGETDYLASDSSLTIPAGRMLADISITVCGDTVIEGTETFEIALSADGAVLARDTAQATIIGDDDVPALQLADVVVPEPGAGESRQAVFRPVLSKNSDFEARFSYTIEPLNAVAGVDYVSTSGTAVIPVGEVETEIPVEILHVPGADEPRSFRLIASEPFNLSFDTDNALGVIRDPAYEPAVEHEQDVVNNEDSVTRLSGPTALALSPDGRHAYVTSESLDAVVAFRRNQADGHLSLIAQYDPSQTGFSTALLDGPMDIRVSPDGKSVYVASKNDDAVVVLSRDEATGTLVFIENQEDGVLSVPDAESPNAGLTGVRRLLVTPDGEFVYAAGTGANGVAVFERDTTTGALRFVEAEIDGQDDPNDAGGAVEGMGQPAGLALSDDGAQLYVASRFGDAVQVFDRNAAEADPDYGRLSFATAYINGLESIDGLNGAFDIAASEDGAHVYVSVEDDDGVVLFDRDADGMLSQRTVWRHETTERPGLRGAQGLAIAPDGLEVFVTGLADHSLSIFERMQAGNEDGLPAGDLRMRQTVFDDSGAVLNMAGPTSVMPSQDDEHVYVVANEDDAIVVFSRISLDVIFDDDFGD